MVGVILSYNYMNFEFFKRHASDKSLLFCQMGLIASAVIDCAWFLCFQLLDTVAALHAYNGPSFGVLTLLSYTDLLCCLHMS